MLKYLIILLILFNSLIAECNINNENKDLIDSIYSSKQNCIKVNDLNSIKKDLCIQTTTIKKKDSNAKDYKSVCLNGVNIAKGYPQLKVMKKTEYFQNDNNIVVNSKYIIIKLDNQLILFSLNNNTSYTIQNSYNNIKTISNDILALEYFSKKTNSYDIKFLNLNDFSEKSIQSKFDDRIRKIHFNNSFIVDQLSKVNATDKKNDSRTYFNILNDLNSDKIKIYQKPTLIKIGNSKKIELKDVQNSYIFDKNLNVISSREISSDFKPISLYQDIKYNLVHGYLSLFILCISIISLIFVFKLLYKKFGYYKLPTITTFFILSYIVFVFIGSTLLNIFYFEYEYNMKFYERKDLLLNIWYFSLIGLFLISSSAVFIINKLQINFNEKTISFFKSDFNFDINEKRLLYLIILLFTISILVLFVYLSKIDIVPIFKVFSGLLPQELAYLRSESGNNFSGKLYRYMIFIKDIPLLLLLIVFLMKNKSKAWNYLFILLLVYNIFVNIMNLSKGPVIHLFLILLLMYFFIQKNISWKKLFIIITILFGLLVIMYITFMGISNSGIFTTVFAPFHRLFIGSISPLFWWQLYVEQYGLLQGVSLPNPAQIFPFEHITITKEVMKFAYPNLVDKGIIGSMPTIFYAEWFANFGWWIAVLSMIVFGVLIGFLDYLFIAKNNKNLVIFSMFVYVMYHFKSYSTTSVSGILIDPHLVVPMFLGLIMYYFTKVNKFEKNNINRIK